MRDYPGLFGWVQYNHKGLFFIFKREVRDIEKRFKDEERVQRGQETVDGKMEERDTGISRWPLEAGMDKEATDCSPRAGCPTITGWL